MRVYAMEKKIESRRKRNYSVESRSNRLEIFDCGYMCFMWKYGTITHVRSLRGKYIDVPNNSAMMSNPIGNRYIFSYTFIHIYI